MASRLVDDPRFSSLLVEAPAPGTRRRSMPKNSAWFNPQAACWGKYRAAIRRELGLTNPKPDRVTLARAVELWQAKQGLAVDGVMGSRTWERLWARLGVLPVPAVTTQLPPNGPGYYACRRPHHRFGLPQTIRALQAIADGWAKAHSTGPRIGIGDLSLRGGGPIWGHSSHQCGIDIDILPMRSDGQEQGVRWDGPGYSRALTQELVDRIRRNGVLRTQYVFFNDPAVKGVTPQPNHDDHLHVRFYPPAATSTPAKSASHELEAAGVRAGRLEVPEVPVLASHLGNVPALVLRWNDMASVPAEIDVVVHLHGYARPWMRLPRDIEPYSGLDLAPVDGAGGRGRSRPTLTVLPRAHFTRTRQRGGDLYVYTFPALDGTDGRRDGLTRLIQFSLNRFAAAVGAATPRVGRLILTAHSGGGKSLLRILHFRLRDPHEVHVFDALYWDPGPLAAWARQHLSGDQGGALRVFYGRWTRPYSRQLQREIAADLKAGLRDRYRVEASSYGHWEIPRNYGWRILANPAANVPRATREPANDSVHGPDRTRHRQRSPGGSRASG
jgi:hypothetical protein